MGNIKQQTLVYPIPDACQSCKYYSRSHHCCDYIEIEHHSRTFDSKGKLIFSKHIDDLTCGEVKEAIEMCKVDVLDKIRAEIVELQKEYKEYGWVYDDALEVIDKYKTESEDGMTREEKIENLLTELIDMIDNGSQRDLDRADEIGTSIIKLLEQEPRYCDRNICLRNEYNGIGCDECEVTKSQESSGDLISRQAVLDLLEDTNNGWIINEVSQLPSVKPQEKTGHWVGIDEEPHEDYECDKCGYVVSTFTENIEPHTEYKFCPNCGAKMEESEDKE